MQEPIAIWSTFIFSSGISCTLSGLCGNAASGTKSSKFTINFLSYTASASGSNSMKSDSLDCFLRKSLVISSLGKIEVVAPSSAPIFVIVALSSTERDFIPSPVYSITNPTPPFTVSSFKT